MTQALISVEWQSPSVWGNLAGMPTGTWREGVDDVARRLRITREALGLTQAEICRLTGIETNAWNNNERGRAMMSLAAAKKLRKVGATLDWIYFGEMAGLSYDLATKIEAHLNMVQRRGRNSL